MTYFIIDTETNGLPQLYDVPFTDTYNWPRLISASWGLYDESGREMQHDSFMVQPDGYRWNKVAQTIHGIAPEEAREYGIPLNMALTRLLPAIEQADAWVCHFAELDYNVVGAEFVRAGRERDFPARPAICTMDASAKITPNGEPLRLDGLYKMLFGRAMKNLHNAEADRLATANCFFELKKRGVL